VKNDAVQFSIDVTGNVTGESWKGLFEALPRLSHRLQLQRDKVRRELLGDAPSGATERALELAALLSDLQVRLTTWPKWWADYKFGLDLLDDNILSEIGDNVVNIIQKEEERLKKRAEEAQEEIRKQNK
jgi:hypothetical protein